MSFNGPKNLSRLCPVMGCGDVEWCSISVRPYCNSCNHWGSVNYGNPQDAVESWHKELINAGHSRETIEEWATGSIEEEVIARKLSVTQQMEEFEKRSSNDWMPEVMLDGCEQVAFNVSNKRAKSDFHKLLKLTKNLIEEQNNE